MPKSIAGTVVNITETNKQYLAKRIQVFSKAAFILQRRFLRKMFCCSSFYLSSFNEMFVSQYICNAQVLKIVMCNTT